MVSHKLTVGIVSMASIVSMAGILRSLTEPLKSEMDEKSYGFWSDGCPHWKYFFNSKKSLKDKMNRKAVTIEELEDKLDDYSMKLKIKISFNFLGNIKIDIKWIARLVVKDIFDTYLDDKYLRITDFQIDRELLSTNFNSIKNQKRKIWFYRIYNKK